MGECHLWFLMKWTLKKSFKKVSQSFVQVKKNLKMFWPNSIGRYAPVFENREKSATITPPYCTVSTVLRNKKYGTDVLCSLDQDYSPSKVISCTVIRVIKNIKGCQEVLLSRSLFDWLRLSVSDLYSLFVFIIQIRIQAKILIRIQLLYLTSHEIFLIT